MKSDLKVKSDSIASLNRDKVASSSSLESSLKNLSEYKKEKTAEINKLIKNINELNELKDGLETSKRIVETEKKTMHNRIRKNATSMIIFAWKLARAETKFEVSPTTSILSSIKSNLNSYVKCTELREERVPPAVGP